MAKWKKSEKVLSEKELENRFLTFYILRVLWKKYNSEGVPKLYDTVGIKVNVYKAILALESKDFHKAAGALEAATGINKGYFCGYSGYRIGLAVKDVHAQDVSNNIAQYIKLRKAGARKNDHEGHWKYDSLRHMIDGWIEKAAKDDIDSQSEPFKKLAYFAEHGRKQTERSADEKMRTINSAIAQIHLSTLGEASECEMKQHYEIVTQYYNRLKSFICMKEWK